MSGTWVPDACTLPTVEQPLRIAEFADLVASASSVQRVEPTRLRVGLAPDPATAATVASLMTRESACCGFFTFTLTATDGTLSLDVVVPPAQAPILNGLASS